jgi:MFS-type transporter involved in bile tolerance (Atg22 family)
MSNKAARSGCSIEVEFRATAYIFLVPSPIIGIIMCAWQSRMSPFDIAVLAMPISFCTIVFCSPSGIAVVRLFSFIMLSPEHRIVAVFADAALNAKAENITAVTTILIMETS